VTVGAAARRVRHGEDTMRNGKVAWLLLAGALAGVSLVCASGCTSLSSVYHKYVMRGQILQVTGDEAYLCIGSRDGARVGDELEVFRNTSLPGNPKFGPRFKREKIGVVRIDAIVDEHYATATIISGTAEVYSIAELERR
jgi:hypothetical protein